MRALPLVLLLAAPLAAAQSGEPITLRFTALDDGFRVEGYDGVNPTIVLEPGTRVVVVLRNLASGSHNLRFAEPIARESDCCTLPGESARLEFTIPQDAAGEAEYSSVGGASHRGVVRVQVALPEVRIESPADGVDVEGDVEMRVAVRRFTLEPYPSSPDRANRTGHLRYLVDGVVALGPTDRTAYVFGNLTQGPHILRVELVERDGAPLSPPVFDEVLVHRLRDPLPTPSDQPVPTTPTGNDTPLPAALAILAALIASRSRRRR